MKIIVVGDVHGAWGKLNTLINKAKPNVILQCGDFGYWPKFDGSIGPITSKQPWRLNGIKNKDTSIYWCDGNHEDHDSLEPLKDATCSYIETMDNVFYMQRGSTLELPDGRIALFMGGATSIDRGKRTPGYDWFPQESVQQADMWKLPDIDIDIIISHTCPTRFLSDVVKNSSIYSKGSDPSCVALDVLLDKYNPSSWYFGHWHKFIEGQYGNTKWACLDMVGGDTRSWVEL